MGVWLTRGALICGTFFAKPETWLKSIYNIKEARLMKYAEQGVDRRMDDLNAYIDVIRTKEIKIEIRLSLESKGAEKKNHFK